MSRSEETLCFTCGLPLGDPPRLNHLPSGQVCPRCSERLLETLPPLLPSGREVHAPEATVELEEVPVLVRGPRRTSGEERELPPGA